MGIKLLEYSKNIIITMIFIVIAFSCSTSETEEGLYCINCLKEEPDSEDISIKLTINNENPKIPITIYDSKFNPENLKDTIYHDTITKSSLTLYVATNKFYSVVATYKTGDITIRSVDGGWFETQKLTGCSNTCWKTLGGSYDLQLLE
jgi:hypothetical protein